MAQSNYPNKYSDRPNRTQERADEWREGHNDRYGAQGWEPDRYRDSSLGEYYPTDNYYATDNYYQGGSDFIDQNYVTGGRAPRSQRENQGGYSGGYRGRNREDENYGAAYREQPRYRGEEESASYHRQARGGSDWNTPDRAGEGAADRYYGRNRNSGRDTYGRGDFYSGYAGPGYGDIERGREQNRGYAQAGGYSDNPPNRYGQQQTSGFRGRGPKGYARSDERIKEDICERLSDDPSVDASEVSVDVTGGTVLLDGTVDSRSVKHRIEDIVADCGGVKDIQNRITVSTSRGGWSNERAASTQEGAGATRETSAGSRGK